MKCILFTVILPLQMLSINALGSNYAKISDLVFTSDNFSEITPDNAYTFEVLEIDGKEIERENSKGFKSSPPYVLVESGNRKMKIVKRRSLGSNNEEEFFELNVTVKAGKIYSITNTDNGPVLLLSKKKIGDENKPAR